MGVCISFHYSADERGSSGGSAYAKRKRRKHDIMEVLAAEAKNNDLLFRMPGRICLNGSTSNGCIFTQQGRKGTNQDAMIFWETFASRLDTTFLGVFDGHGPLGHLVAKKVRDSLPSKVSALYKTLARQEIQTSSSLTSTHNHCEKKESVDRAEEGQPLTPLEEGSDSSNLFETWKDCFLKAFHAMDKDLKSHPTIDCFCSGTTAVTMVLQGKDMVVANVGDSRAVLATLSQEDATKVEPVQLTVDLKPNLPLEAERIKRCKGRVFALEDEPEVARVWLPHDDSPGLAMARAFGDFCLKDFGLISVPEVTHFKLTERDQFVVLASDGVWDVLSNKEVVETIWDAPTCSTAARSVVETAVRAWRLKYPTSKVDDCAVVCFFLNKQKWKARTAVSSCSAIDLGMDTDPRNSVDSKSAAPPELQRSNTLRCGGRADADDVEQSSEESRDSDNLVAESCTSMEANISIDGGAGMILAEAGAQIDDTDSTGLIGALSTDVKVEGCMEAASEAGALKSSSGETAGAVASQVDSSPSGSRSAERSEVLDILAAAANEEASSEITALSDAGDDEGGKPVGAAVMGRSSSRRSLAECLSVADEDEWTALEGVARVNSLMTLPRFWGGEKRAGRRRAGAGKGRKRKGRGRRSGKRWW